jgi:3-oxoacyl-[acyl-carrier protein] reductase
LTEEDLEGVVLVVTGGSRGIGRATVLAAAARGARVAFCSRHEADQAEVVAAAANLGRPGRVLSITADVSREADVDALFEAALRAYGAIDAVVSNAGSSREGLLVSLTAEDWDAVLATNLTGSFLVARRAVRTFLERGRGGRIVFMGSLQQNGAPRGAAAYATTKGGLAGLTRAIAWEYGARGIRANQVVTGYVDTALTRHLPESARRLFAERCPQRRLATPEEIASVLLFLASERSQGVSGETVYASGGMMEISL